MSFWSDLGGVAAGAGSMAMGVDMANKLGQTGEDASKQMGELAAILKGDTAFKGYGVTTGIGSGVTVDADGNTNYGTGKDATLGLQAGSNYTGAGANLNAAANAALNNATNTSGGMGVMEGAQGMIGGSNAGINQHQAGMLGASQHAMQNSMQGTAGSEQEIYDRMMSMQNPALDAQQASQQANEFAMGRGGVRGSQFGGTAEDAAMARARAGASQQASVQAMGQAQQEMMNQGQLSQIYGQQGLGAAGQQLQAGAQMGSLGSMMHQAGLGNAQLGQASGSLLAQIGQGQGALAGQQYGQQYADLQNQLALMQGGQNNAGLYQSGQMTGAGYGAQLGIGGMQAQINAEKAATELYGNLFDSVMDNSGQIGESIGGVVGEGWDFLKGLF